MLEGWLYDWENERSLQRQNGDIAFYQAVLERYAGHAERVLELGCGTGRVTLPLARAGHRLTAVDLSKDRLDVLHWKAGGSAIQIVHADMCSYSAPATFDAIFVPYSSFLLLESASARAACLSRISENLRPGGVAVVDLSPNFLAHRETAEHLVLQGGCAALGAHVRYFEAVRQDYVRQLTRFSKRYELRRLEGATAAPLPAEVRTEETWSTLKVDEVRWLVAQSKLEIRDIFGTYALEPLFEGERWRTGSYKNIYVLAGRGS